MRYCDLNEDILYWASEELAIRYYNPLDKKYHSYYPDFIVRTIKGDKILVEIKPSRQTKRPKTPKKKTSNPLENPKSKGLFDGMTLEDFLFHTNDWIKSEPENPDTVSYTHLTLPTNREV